MIQSLIEGLEHSGMGGVLVTLIVAMLPIIELRGAIPVGVAMGLDLWAAVAISLVGSTLPAPFIILFSRKIFAFFRKHSAFMARLIDRFENSIFNKSKRAEKYKFFGHMLFVALPLPGAGTWTGAFLAAFMEMRLKHALPSIIAGTLIEAVIVTGITYGFTAIF